MKQNISSQLKYTIDLGVTASKITFKLKKTKKDIISHILVTFFIFVMTALLVWDMSRGAGFVLDIIILGILVVTEIITLLMPVIITNTQKKFLKQLNLQEIDYIITSIEKDKCLETYYKNGKVFMQNVCMMSKLINYKIQDNYVFIVFNNFACAIFDINTLTISLEEFTEMLNNKISANKGAKTKR